MAKLKPGINDLRTLAEELCTEWDYEKNGPDRPENFTYGSGEIVWWKCKNGHSWLAKIQNRYKGEGCPYCFGLHRYIRRFV